MPLPRTVARFNRAVWNNVTKEFTPHIPGFATIEHRGRRSGRLYRTPVNVFRRPDGTYAIPLVYGRKADWLRNVLAAGECVIETNTRTIGLVNPRIVSDPSLTGLPFAVRHSLRVMRVDEVLELHRA